MEIFRSALRSIASNKFRTFLTMLGVIIGVMSVVLLTSIGAGLQASVQSQFDELGANTIYIQPGNLIGKDGSFNTQQSGGGSVNSATVFKKTDIKLIKDSSPHILQVVPQRQGSTKITFRNVSESAIIIGSTDEIFGTTGVKIGSGRYYSRQEYIDSARVVFMGSSIAEKVFGPNVSPLEKKVKISGKEFKVVGVGLSKGASMGGPSFDDYLYLPLDQVSEITGENKINQFVVKVDDKNSITQVKRDIRKVLEERLNNADAEFSVFDQSQLLGAIDSILGAITVGLGGIAAISLVVGGIGIMNIMLVSVSERTREIGLRKALGATPADILIQFLIESALLSVVGGLTGVALAALIGQGINSFIPTKISLDAVILAFSVSLGVGIVFGVAPAKTASKLQPIEALRSE